MDRKHRHRHSQAALRFWPYFHKGIQQEKVKIPVRPWRRHRLEALRAWENLTTPKAYREWCCYGSGLEYNLNRTHWKLRMTDKNGENQPRRKHTRRDVLRLLAGAPALSLLAGPMASQDATLTSASTGVRQIIVVCKTHFDLGYSHRVKDLLAYYRTTMIDRALEVMDQGKELPSNSPMRTILFLKTNFPREPEYFRVIYTNGSMRFKGASRSPTRPHALCRWRT
jgi:hypothetical protein